jgi:hypothetical protein
MPLMLVVILVSLVQNTAIVYYSFVALWVFILFVVGDMIITSAREEARDREVRRSHREGPRLVRRDAHRPDALHAPAEAAGQARPVPA